MSCAFDFFGYHFGLSSWSSIDHVTSHSRVGALLNLSLFLRIIRSLYKNTNIEEMLFIKNVIFEGFRQNGLQIRIQREQLRITTLDEILTFVEKVPNLIFLKKCRISKFNNVNNSLE